MSVGSVAELLAELAGAPRLAEAACRGHAWAYDPPAANEDRDDVRDRHRLAVAVCRGCPALADCRRWLDALPQRQRPFGVVAGRVRSERKQGQTVAEPTAVNPENPERTT